MLQMRWPGIRLAASADGALVASPALARARVRLLGTWWWPLR
jgi:hypothetical protein